MKKFNVIEDNGGGLTLVTFVENGNIDYLHTGYEYCPGQLQDDLKELERNVPIKFWDGNNLHTLDTENPEDMESWFPWEEKGIGWDIVADNAGIYPEVMGTAALIEFNIRRA